MLVVTFEFNPTLTESFPTTKIASVCWGHPVTYVCSQLSIFVAILKITSIGLKEWWNSSSKTALIPPHWQVPTRYHKNSLSFNRVGFHLLLVEIVNDLIPTIQRKEIRNVIKSYYPKPNSGWLHTIPHSMDTYEIWEYCFIYFIIAQMKIEKDNFFLPNISFKNHVLNVDKWIAYNSNRYQLFNTSNVILVLRYVLNN